MNRGLRARLPLSAVLAGLACCLLGAVTLPAVQRAGLQTHAQASVAIFDDGNGQALFAGNVPMAPGHPRASCLSVGVASAEQGQSVTFAAERVSGALAAHLLVRVDMGTGGHFGDCSGFTGSTVWTGTLDQLASETASGDGEQLSWDPAADSTRSFRVTVDVADTPAAVNKAATGDFAWRLISPAQPLATPAPVPNSPSPTSESPTPTATPTRTTASPTETSDPTHAPSPTSTMAPPEPAPSGTPTQPTGGHSIDPLEGSPTVHQGDDDERSARSRPTLSAVVDAGTDDAGTDGAGSSARGTRASREQALGSLAQDGAGRQPDIVLSGDLNQLFSQGREAARNVIQLASVTVRSPQIPITAIVLAGLFLLVQDRISRRDPKTRELASTDDQEIDVPDVFKGPRRQ